MNLSKNFINQEKTNLALYLREKSIKYRNSAEFTRLIKKKEFYLPKRYVFVFLGFLGMFNVYSMRVNLSVAMVAMVNQTEKSISNISQHHETECPGLVDAKDRNSTKEYKGEQYNWDTKTQGAILGAFFYGYIITQIPGGILSEKFGSKWFFGGGIMVTSVLSLITPLSARWGTATLIAVRVIEGFGEGVTFPAINLAISKWSPKYQRSRLSTIIFSGNQVGNVIAMPVSGILSSINFLGGWPSVFYVFGGIGCVWFFLWSLIMHESPATHPSISLEELKLIEESREEKMKFSIPWRSIFTSIPMYALICAHFGYSFGFSIMFAELPTYLNSILHFDLKSDGFLSALPYIAQAVGAWSISFVADKLRESNTMSVTNIRKLFNTLGCFGPALCLIGITVTGCRPELIVGLLCLGMLFSGCIYSGYHVTHIDMCPDFSGTLYAITNAIANLSGIIGPMIVGYFTSTGETIANWSSVFYTTAGVYFFCGATFAIFGSAELQPWATAQKEEPKTTEIAKNMSVSEAPLEIQP